MLLPSGMMNWRNRWPEEEEGAAALQQYGTVSIATPGTAHRRPFSSEKQTGLDAVELAGVYDMYSGRWAGIPDFFLCPFNAVGVHGMGGECFGKQACAFVSCPR